MRIEYDADGITRVYFRQSWINDFLLCNDRARLAVDSEATNEAAALGTSLHSGIEAALRRNAVTPSEVLEISRNTLVGLEPTFVYDELTRDKCVAFLAHWSNMLRSQPEFLSLIVNPDALIEHEFDVPLAYRGNVELRLTGTIDAVDRPNYLVDWKTTGRKYQRWEKQRWAVQPTVYAEACRQMGWIESDTVDFRFVVFQKSLSVPAPEVIRVTRGPGHTAWLTRMLWRAYDLDDLDEWPLNDNHALCSQKWCPVWDKCKGLYIKPDFNA
jgi:hypothetical protein